ncbi:ankyrin repeat domain-containing protein 50-like [Haliotis asinina]|uniref:ankyrin repeat domain-containing protein 50-like n=1 Tax=Haliotis asinina TaxID=109174 RepID=UPI003531B323
MWAASGGHREVVALLVSKGANLSIIDRFGINILHSACLGGDVEVVKYVLSENMLNINSREQCGRTAVMLAAENGHKDLVVVLADNGADVSLVDRTGDNILHCACRGGGVEVVKYILSKKMVYIDSKGHYDKTPVMLAGRNGHTEVVKLLVNYGANLSLRDTYGHNILHSACSEGHVDVVKYILSKDIVDINSEGYKRRTPMMLAAMVGHKEVVDLLVKNGADLTFSDIDGHNILYCSSATGQLEVVKYIISLNTVDINSAGHFKRTSVMVAARGGHKEVVEFLVNHGAKLTLTDKDTNNILHLTSLGGSLEVMKYLLSLNAVNINSRGWKKRTPVMFAADKGYKGLVELFVNSGAQLSLKDIDGDNILLLAVSHLEVVKYILSLRVVKVNARNRKWESAATRAKTRRRRDVLNLLLSYGART